MDDLEVFIGTMKSSTTEVFPIQSNKSSNAACKSIHYSSHQTNINPGTYFDIICCITLAAKQLHMSAAHPIADLVVATHLLYLYIPYRGPSQR